MFPTALDDLIEDDESLYEVVDPYEEHCRYLDRCRRVRIGHSAAAVFENRRTLRFRVQELVRVGRATHPDRVRGAMEWYRSLLPGAGRLLASVTLRDRLRRFGWPMADDAAPFLRAGEHVVPGTLLADSGGDRIIGLVRWVEFHFSPADRAVLADLERPVVLGYAALDGERQSPPLSAAVRRSLLSDLGSPADD